MERCLILCRELWRGGRLQEIGPTVGPTGLTDPGKNLSIDHSSVSQLTYIGVKIRIRSHHIFVMDRHGPVFFLGGTFWHRNQRYSAGDLGEYMYFVSSADCQSWGYGMVGQITIVTWHSSVALGWGGQVRYAWAGSQSPEERVEWKAEPLRPQLFRSQRVKIPEIQTWNEDGAEEIRSWWLIVDFQWYFDWLQGFRGRGQHDFENFRNPYRSNLAKNVCAAVSQTLPNRVSPHTKHRNERKHPQKKHSSSDTNISITTTYTIFCSRKPGGNPEHRGTQRGWFLHRHDRDMAADPTATHHRIGEAKRKDERVGSTTFGGSLSLLVHFFWMKKERGPEKTL